jgi:hypothetical protein
MALMLLALYVALLDAGASVEKARAAAEEVAQYQARFVSLDGRLAHLDDRLARLDDRMAHLDGRLLMLQWILGISCLVMFALHLITLHVLWQIGQRLP